MATEMRVFVAIDVPNHVRAELETLQSSLATGRLVPGENLHLTLCFLGAQPAEAIEEAHQALSAQRIPAFDAQLVGVGAFGKRSPKVIFADVRRCDELIDLERRLTRSLRNAGLRFQKRRFRPHVTIARLPKSLSAYELEHARSYLAENAAFRGACFRVRSFRMYKSILMPGAALHEVLASYDLVDT